MNRTCCLGIEGGYLNTNCKFCVDNSQEYRSLTIKLTEIYTTIERLCPCLGCFIIKRPQEEKYVIDIEHLIRYCKGKGCILAKRDKRELNEISHSMELILQELRELNPYITSVRVRRDCYNNFIVDTIVDYRNV